MPGVVGPTAPLAIPPYRRRTQPLSDDEEPDVASSPDMVFAMSVEPESVLHGHMMSSTTQPSSAQLSTKDSLDSFDAMFTRHRRTSPPVTPSPGRRPMQPIRSISALTHDSEPLLYAFPTPSRRGPLSLPQNRLARGFGVSPSVLLTSTSAAMAPRHRADREVHARARAIVASSSRHTSPPTSSSTSATSSRSASPDTSAATSLASSRSPSRDDSKSQQSSAETVSAMLSEALRHDLRGLGGSPLGPRAPWKTPSRAEPRVSTDVASSYRPDEGLMRKMPSPMSPARVLAAYADRGRRRGT